MQYDIRERVNIYGGLDQLQLLTDTQPEQHSLGSSLGASLPTSADHPIPENHRSFLEGLEAQVQPLAPPDLCQGSGQVCFGVCMLASLV